MRIKLLKCAICHDWHSPHRAHCPNCGATRIPVGSTLIHVDAANEYKPGILMGRPQSYFSVQWLPDTSKQDTLLQIARELSR